MDGESLEGLEQRIGEDVIHVFTGMPCMLRGE